MTAQKEVLAAIARVEAALSAAARSRHIPDYHGFQEKIGGQLLKERTARAGALHPDPGPTTIAAISLLSKYHQRMNDGSFSPINFRRFKLLFSLFNGSARGSQMVSALLQDSLPSDPTLDADDITPAQLRMRLIIAVEKGAYDDASFLVGLLDEVDHDPGAVEHILGRKTGAKELVELLEPLIAKGSLAAFRICVETLLDAGEFGILVRYAQRFPYNPSLPWHRELDIVGALYTAAVLRDDGLERRLKRLLPSDRAEPSVGAARRLDIARRLTSMGRLSFLSAATELDHVRAVDDLWRDCGLISLGLFRALELEFNSRLVRPLAGRLDITTLRSQLPPRIALGSTLKELGKVLQSGHGLMLGSLRTLLMQFVPESADDLATLGVRQQVRSEFDRLLSSVTDKDRALWELSNMISETVVRSYRNPPAHGQFLRIGEAVAALKHVEDALDSVTTFLPIAQ